MILSIMESQPPDYLNIAAQFKIEGDPINYQPISVGLINQTLDISTTNASYILQRINQYVFKNPVQVMDNIEMVADHLKRENYPRQILKPIPTKQGKNYYVDQDGKHWRMYPRVENTISYDWVDNSEVAYEAAMAFGEYVCYLKELNPEKLQITIPNFHNTPFRFQNFLNAKKDTFGLQLKWATPLFDQIDNWADKLLKMYAGVAKPEAVVHNDTKISNLLFDSVSKEPVCVIDLDTLMPGMLAYDFGDMVRTCAASVDENNRELNLVSIRGDIYSALLEGYLESTSDRFSYVNRPYLETGTALVIFEQGLRFLTDFMQNTGYYETDYASQNLDRAKNQFVLLEDFLKRKTDLT